jgi:hypothetical protein
VHQPHSYFGFVVLLSCHGCSNRKGMLKFLEAEGKSLGAQGGKARLLFLLTDLPDVQLAMHTLNTLRPAVRPSAIQRCVSGAEFLLMVPILCAEHLDEAQLDQLYDEGKQLQNALVLFARAEHKKQIFELLSRYR